MTTRQRRAAIIALCAILFISLTACRGEKVPAVHDMSVYFTDTGFRADAYILKDDAEANEHGLYSIDQFETATYECEDDDLSKELKAMIAAESLEGIFSQSGDARGNKADDADKQKAVLNATNLIKSSYPYFSVRLSGYTTQKETLRNPRIYELCLYDCDAENLEAYGITALVLESSTGMQWENLASYDKLTKITLSTGDNVTGGEAREQGFFPADFAVLNKAPSLKTVRMLIWCDYTEETQPPFLYCALVKGDTSDYEAIKEYVPFSLEELEKFLDDDEKVIEIFLDPR